ncbi:MAG: c-type cytochrome [Candidatus Acidiferrales bacterium]
MRTVVLVMALALLFIPAFGGPPPDSRWLNGMDLSWAFPEPSPDFPPEDKSVVKHVPGSTKSYTQGQIDDTYNPPDWYPEEHEPFPRVVAKGDGKATPGCASCHLASGSGHPESANLTGLTADYMITQLHDFQQGLRTDPLRILPTGPRMSGIAKGMTEEDVKEASAYFASQKPRRWIRVVETDMVPETYINAGRRRYVRLGGKMEPIGSRIIEVPEDPELVTCRDPHTGFVAYVPPGSIAKGEALATTGAGKTTACIACHGPALTGIGPVPWIAGHSPNYIVRQLAEFQVGARNSDLDQLMKGVVANLTQDDIISLAAYVSSRFPDKQ